MKNFWTPAPANKPGVFSLTATEAACVGPPERQFFMGGVAMAAAIEASEQATGKSLLWATMHFVSHGMLGDEIEFATTSRGGGRSVAQLGLVSSVGDRALQHMSAALGGRDGHSETQFLAMPDVPPPEDCPAKTSDAFAQPGNLIAQFERRTALEDNDAGVEHLWMRPIFDAPLSAGLLALMADFFLGAHEHTRGGTSLDNTFRLHGLRETEWVLCSTRFSGFSNGAVHGVQYQFAEDGTVLSTSSQTGLLPRNPE